MYILKLPFPPSINDYYGITCNGNIPHKYIKTKGKKHRSDTLLYAIKNKLQLRANVPLNVEILVNVPDKRTHDIDNILKCLFDSMTQAEIWEDDSLIRELHVFYGTQEKEGSILVKIQEYKET